MHRSLAYLVFLVIFADLSLCRSQESAGTTETTPGETSTPPSRSVQTPSANPSYAAKKHFLHGRALMEDSNYKAALAEFELAKTLDKDNVLRCDVRYNIAICFQELFRYSRALQLYLDYQRTCPKEAALDHNFERRLQALRAKLASLEIEVNVPAEIWVNNSPRGQAPGKLTIAGGSHAIELRASGYEPVKKEIQIASGETRKFRFELDKISEFHGLNPAYFWAASAVTAVSLGLATYFGIDALSLSEDAENRGASEDVLLNTSDTEKEINDAQLKTDVFLAITGGLALGTGLLFFLTDWEGAGSRENTEQTAVQFRITTFHQNVTVSGAF